jgi:two-component system vancomycin resistance associated response regulator VraR
VALQQLTGTLKVLIVDDHELTRLTLKLLIAKQPFVSFVLEAMNGSHAIAQVEKYVPDIILMDLHMPVMDGWTASQKIRQEFPHIKIIAYSAVETRHLQHLLDQGIIDAFCDKAICSEQILGSLRAMCRNLN